MTQRTLPVWILSLLACAPGALLGCSGEAELFDKSSAAISDLVGKSCELSAAPSANEITIEHPEVCGETVCLGVGEEPSHCSCRCSGPDNGLPLCACPSAFHCQDELIVDLQLGSYYAGGYCVPN